MKKYLLSLFATVLFFILFSNTFTITGAGGICDPITHPENCGGLNPGPWQDPAGTPPPACSTNPQDPTNYRLGCNSPINVSNAFQSKTGGLSVGHPAIGGLIINAGVWIRGVLKLPFGVTSASDVDKVLTLTDDDGTASWRLSALTCEDKSATILPTATAPWQTATTPVCPVGYKVIGGDVQLSPESANTDLSSVYTESYQSPSGAEAWVGRLRGLGLGATVYARCCKFR
jgi:hypothetical protein